MLPGETKNDEGRLVKVTDEVFELLRPCVQGKKPEDAVFTWGDGGDGGDGSQCWTSEVPGIK
jgi:hypothetical protein